MPLNSSQTWRLTQAGSLIANLEGKKVEVRGPDVREILKVVAAYDAKMVAREAVGLDPGGNYAAVGLIPMLEIYRDSMKEKAHRSAAAEKKRQEKIDAKANK